jgi:hypothetical protein
MNVSINFSTWTRSLKLLSTETALSLLTRKGSKYSKHFIVCEI